MEATAINLKQEKNQDLLPYFFWFPLIIKSKWEEEEEGREEEGREEEEERI